MGYCHRSHFSHHDLWLHVHQDQGHALCCCWWLDRSWFPESIWSRGPCRRLHLYVHLFFSPLIYSHPFRWFTVLHLPYAPTRCPNTNFPNSPTSSGLSLYCCHYRCLFSPPLPLPCKESWLPFQALPLRGHSHVSSSGIHFSLASYCNTRQNHKTKKYYTQAALPPPSPANTSTYRLLTFFF